MLNTKSGIFNSCAKQTLVEILIVITCSIVISNSASANDHYPPDCNNMPGLTLNQRQMCFSQPEVLNIVSRGLNIGDKECRRQFRHHKWNCTALGEITLMGPQLKIATKEAAFESSLKSASVLYSFMTACSENKLRGCGCKRHTLNPSNDRRHNRHSTSDISLVRGWSWGGCGSEIKKAVEYSINFLHHSKPITSDRNLMDAHNQEVGRKVVTNYLRAKCKCHGASGSCTTRTCWVIMPSIREIAGVMKRKYNKAQKVVASYYGHRATYLHLANTVKYVRPKRKNLVYLHDSPTYCDENVLNGIPGTVARRCNATSKKADNCEIMCCDRGYSVQNYTRRWQCDCKFFWCCKVHCNICQENEMRHICN